MRDIELRTAMRYITDEDRQEIWNDIFDDVLPKMEQGDQKILRQMVDQMVHDRGLKNIGRKAARELLVVIGIWMVLEIDE